MSDLAKMFMDSTFSDVTFTVQGQDIPGHKNILAMRCPHFVSMFTSSKDETIFEKENKIFTIGDGTKLSKVEVSDVEYKTFKGEYLREK